MHVPIIYKIKDLPPRYRNPEYFEWYDNDRICQEHVLSRCIELPTDLQPQIFVSEIELRSPEERTRISLERDLHNSGYETFCFHLEKLYLEYYLWNDDMEPMLPGRYNTHVREFYFYLHTKLEIDDCRLTIATAIAELERENFKKRREAIGKVPKSLSALSQMRKINNESEIIFRGIENWKNEKQ